MPSHVATPANRDQVIQPLVADALIRQMMRLELLAGSAISAPIVVALIDLSPRPSPLVGFPIGRIPPLPEPALQMPEDPSEHAMEDGERANGAQECVLQSGRMFR
jgi:hypothetical protein